MDEIRVIGSVVPSVQRLRIQSGSDRIGGRDIRLGGAIAMRGE